MYVWGRDAREVCWGQGVHRTEVLRSCWGTRAQKFLQDRKVGEVGACWAANLGKGHKT